MLHYGLKRALPQLLKHVLYGVPFVSKLCLLMGRFSLKTNLVHVKNWLGFCNLLAKIDLVFVYYKNQLDNHKDRFSFCSSLENIDSIFCTLWKLTWFLYTCIKTESVFVACKYWLAILYHMENPYSFKKFTNIRLLSAFQCFTGVWFIYKQI